MSPPYARRLGICLRAQQAIWLINLSSCVIKFSEMLADCNPKQGNYPIIKAALFLSFSAPFSLSSSTPFPGWVCSYLCSTWPISHEQKAPALQLSQSNPGLDRAQERRKRENFQSSRRPESGDREQPEQQKKGILGSAVAIKG